MQGLSKYTNAVRATYQDLVGIENAHTVLQALLIWISSVFLKQPPQDLHTQNLEQLVIFR